MSRNIRTLGDVDGNNSHDSGEGSDGGERRQEFYVGGSEQSGQQVLGPETGRRDIREAVFNAAREVGAQEFNPDDDAETSQFGCSLGIRLGRTNDDHVMPTPPQRAAPPVYYLYLWENGFSVNDGPLRDPNNRADRDFITDCLRHRIPQELSIAHPDQDIDIRLERKSGPYVPPKSKPFEGTGARLGGVVPSVVSSAPLPPGPSSSQHANESEDSLAKAQAEVQLDPNTPKTKLQIRLQDGTRLVGEFNSTHTVASIRNFIVTARPQLAFQEFQLMTTYPPKVIDDETSSLSDAGLLGAVIAIKPIS